jgi:hypothetical protein
MIIKKVTLSISDINKDDLLNEGKSLWDKICYFIAIKIWPLIRDYRFIIFGIFVILLICIIIIWARKHIPSRGRIIDLYDATGERKDKKIKRGTENELHDLPKEFYKRK